MVKRQRELEKTTLRHIIHRSVINVLNSGLMCYLHHRENNSTYCNIQHFQWSSRCRIKINIHCRASLRLCMKVFMCGVLVMLCCVNESANLSQYPSLRCQLVFFECRIGYSESRVEVIGRCSLR